MTANYSEQSRKAAQFYGDIDLAGFELAATNNDRELELFTKAVAALSRDGELCRDVKVMGAGYGRLVDEMRAFMPNTDFELVEICPKHIEALRLKFQDSIRQQLGFVGITQKDFFEYAYHEVMNPSLFLFQWATLVETGSRSNLEYLISLFPREARIILDMPYPKCYEVLIQDYLEAHGGDVGQFEVPLEHKWFQRDTTYKHVVYAPQKEDLIEIFRVNGFSLVFQEDFVSKAGIERYFLALQKCHQVEPLK